MNATLLPQLLAALARAVANEQRQAAVGAGLLPVQLTILSYLRDANRYSNTQQGLTEYLGLTKGTVSQSLKVLEERSLITRCADEADRRIVRLTLTAAGRERLGQAMDDAWAEACQALGANQQQGAATALSRLLGAWQQARHGKTFGVCHSCRHFRPGQPTHQCGLTGEALSDDDSQHICREHSLPPAGPSQR
ncbi:MarR family winged helix-turn-helix transcriptional regulator [Dechloromonas sp. A34]|uniref:MarR family winged helix-turn-helix transcriptional regulator n=1 Tax=Dechloromonas sp. A34 TaxID=447588 RepID=UPI0022490AFE|nr:MarR family winged helix-turn-helix transcriptional regulator [Dechloromonas sp. A34]